MLTSIAKYAASIQIAQGATSTHFIKKWLHSHFQTPDNAMQVESQIREKLTDAFAPSHLVIENESHKHAGHAGMKGLEKTGETHFNVHIVSERFSGCSRVQRHRMVNEVLAAELAGPVHALSVKAKTPEESANEG